MSLDNVFFLSLLSSYLGIQERWKLLHLSQATRAWIRSPDQEKASMIGCLQQCYGLWRPAHRKREEALSWIEIEMALAKEQEFEESRNFSKFELPGAKFRKLETPSLSSSRHTLRYLSRDWIGEKLTGSARPKPLIQIDLYELVDGSIQAFRNWNSDDLIALTKLTTNHTFPTWQWPEGLPKSQMSWDYKVKEFFPVARFWNSVRELEEQLCHAQVNFCEISDCMPREIAIPFHIRLALTDSSLVKQLIDVNDKQMTPGIFLKLYDIDAFDRGYDPREEEDDKSDDYTIPDGTSGIWRSLINLYLSNTKIFEIEPSEFWEIDKPIGQSTSKSDWCHRYELFNMNYEFAFWTSCAEALIPHFDHYAGVILDALGSHGAGQPLDLRKLQAEEFTTEEGWASRESNKNFAHLHIRLGGGYNTTFRIGSGDVSEKRSVNLFVSSGGVLVYRVCGNVRYF